MSNTIVKTTIEFIVRGKETYYALLDFGKTRKEVIAVVKKLVTEMVAKLSAMANDPGDLTVKLIFKSTGDKPVKLVFKNISAKRAFEFEYALVEAQKQMLDAVSKL